MIRRPPRSTRVRSSAASDVYKRQIQVNARGLERLKEGGQLAWVAPEMTYDILGEEVVLGGLVAIPSYEIVSIEAVSGAAGQILVRVRPPIGQDDCFVM